MRTITKGLVGGLVALAGLVGCERKDPDAEFIQYYKESVNYKEIGYVDNVVLDSDGSSHLLIYNRNDPWQRYFVRHEEVYNDTKTAGSSGQAWICEADGELHATLFLK